MQIVEGQFVYSATDLNNELECRYLTELERKVALRELQRPEPEASIALISAKGEAHEQRHLARLQQLHGDANVVVFATRSEPTLAGMRAAEAATVAAMAEDPGEARPAARPRRGHRVPPREDHPRHRGWPAPEPQGMGCLTSEVPPQTHWKGNGSVGSAS